MDSFGSCMPSVWGPGQLLAFSGLDGMTSWARPFVFSTTAVPGGLLLRLPGALEILPVSMPVLTWRLVLGDTLLADSEQGPFAAVFRDHDTLLGILPHGTGLRMGGTDVGPEPVPVLEAAGQTIWAARREERWFLSSGSKDCSPCSGLLDEPWEPHVAARTQVVASVRAPSGFSEGGEQLLRKAVSVMKVNTHAANGTIGRRWSTPDRWPHQHMWLWDSAFHAIGMCFVDVSVAQDDILAVLEQLSPEGMLSHMMRADGKRSEITQPPILSWATLLAFDAGADSSWVRTCLPLLKRYLDWDRMYRDRNGNGIPEWYIEGNPLCRCGESGLDNSSVYDRAVLLDAPDFGSFLYNDYVCLASLAERLGENTLAAECRAHALGIGRAIDELLWSEDDRFYFHRDFAGHHVPVKAISGFMPLFAGIPSPQRARRLAEHLTNPCTFGAPALVPSESLDSGTFSKDMWRGPAWMNLSYCILLGLRRYGFQDEAARLKENMLSTIGSWYETSGCLWEYYDSLNCTSPGNLDRKQRLISGKGMAPISDYHWTAAITAALLLEDV